MGLAGRNDGSQEFSRRNRRLAGVAGERRPTLAPAQGLRPSVPPADSSFPLAKLLQPIFSLNPCGASFPHARDPIFHAKPVRSIVSSCRTLVAYSFFLLNPCDASLPPAKRQQPTISSSSSPATYHCLLLNPCNSSFPPAKPLPPIRCSC